MNFLYLYHRKIKNKINIENSKWIFLFHFDMSLADLIVNPKNFIEEKIIGEGSFSQVFLVHLNKNNNKKLALKQIDVGSERDDWQKTFIREISVMSTLNHPAIIHFYGFTLPSREFNFVQIYTDYLPNGTLLNALKNDETNTTKTLTPTIRSIIIYGIVAGMNYLHKNNIIHRDLKPENIFLNKNYYPIISDFGLSKFSENDLFMTTKLGTPYFMAPELFNEESDSENKVTNKIDVYAFSVTLLSFFTTSYKFNGTQPRTISQLINKVTEGVRYTIPKDTPKYYSHLIKRCWDGDQDKRPSFDKILNEFDHNDDFIFKGSNKKQVHDYMKMLSKAKIEIKANDSSDSASYEDKSEEDTKEFNFV